jgi:hypothetical protein
MQHTGEVYTTGSLLGQKENLKMLCFDLRELVDSSTGMEACYRKYRNFLVV